MQHGAAQDADDDGDDHREGRGEPEAIGNKAAQPVLVALAEFLRDRNDKAVADADAEAEDKEIDRAGRADARQRVDAEIAPDDERIDHIIKLLEQQPAEQGQQEAEDQLHRRADGQVFYGAFLHRDLLSQTRIVYYEARQLARWKSSGFLTFFQHGIRHSA